MPPKSIWSKYGYSWVTAGFLIVTLIGHWIFGWFAFVNEPEAHNQPVEFSSFSIEMLRDTMENWQSEFLQLIWQVAGLSILLHLGSPASKEGDDRMEAKLDALLMAVQGEKGTQIVNEIDEMYTGRHTDAGYAKRVAEKEERGGKS